METENRESAQSGQHKGKRFQKRELREKTRTIIK